MFKCLDPSALGVSGRQSELIELAMTYGFRGLVLDAADILKRATLQGTEEAAKYIHSAKVKATGWKLPVDLAASDDAFEAGLVRLRGLVEAAKYVGFEFCTTQILPISADLPYHENFERHRERLSKACEVLGQQKIRLGVALTAAAAQREDGRHQFIHQAEELLTLLKTIDAENIGLALDTWNWKVGGGGMDQLSELPSGKVVCVSIADVPEDADPKTITVKDRRLPTEETIPGYGKLLKMLAEREFKGPVTIVPHPSQLSKLPRDASVEASAKALNDIWAAAGLSKSGKLLPATEPTADTVTESAAV